MNEQCKKCAWMWEKCDEHVHCNDCPMNNAEICGRRRCYCAFVGITLNGNCAHFVPRKESGDEDDTEM